MASVYSKNMLSFGPGHCDWGRGTSVHYCLLVLSGNIVYGDCIQFFPYEEPVRLEKKAMKQDQAS